MADAGTYERLCALLGTRGEAILARDPVNQPMIRHWCDAMEDDNPVYTDPAIAARSVFGEVVAPATMLNTWSMLGLTRRPAGSTGDDPQSRALRVLDAAGFTSVVATNCDHEYDRPLVLGDHLSSTIELVEVSPEKKTALGVGHFVTTQTEYRDLRGERVGAMRFRILKFAPGTGRVAPGGAGGASAAAPTRRLAPSIPDGASGRATLVRVLDAAGAAASAFGPERVAAEIELAEGGRVEADVVDLARELVVPGVALELAIDESDPDSPVPVFRIARAPRRASTRGFDAIEVGERLAPCPIPITTTRIVATAIASRDYQDVHHDPVLARRRGSPDIFMNILTSGGLCGRYVSDWAGPEARFLAMHIRLGAPNYPGDCMTMYGEVAAKERRGGRGIATIALRGANRLGDHVTGTIELALPDAEGPALG
ncbi:MAG: MaoC family dehydratase N-terminal domain-containing protein [Myxococcota bacterium]